MSENVKQSELLKLAANSATLALYKTGEFMLFIVNITLVSPEISAQVIPSVLDCHW